MKKLSTLLFFIVLSLTVWSYDFSVGQLCYNILSETEVEITYEHNPIGGNSAYPSLSGDIVIPSSVTYNETTYMVTSVGDSAFYDCSFSSITIPNSVISIGEWAFSRCSFTSITIPNSVATIEESAFWGCSSLPSIAIPNSVISIEYFAFAYCSSLVSVAIPSSVTNIEDGIFAGCSSLTDIQVAYDNPSYISENGVLFNVDKTDLVQYPAGKTETSYIIPSSVTSIKEAAFLRCSFLTSVTIPNSIIIIGSFAFFECSSLTSITIPKSVTNIGIAPFWLCPNIGEMTVLATTPPIANSNLLDQRDIPLYVPAASIEAYRIADEWKGFTNILPLESLTHKQLEVAITGNGIIQYGETTLTEEGTLYIEPETEVTLKLLPDDGFEIVQVMYNGTDYSSNVNDEGILTLPVMEENASLDVSFQPIHTSNELCITDANQRVVFFKAPQSYNSDVYVYMWKDNGFVGEYELTPSWPGTQAISQGDGYYRFYIPESWGEPEADWMIIWSDGKGSGYLDGQQTEDLPFTMRALYAGSSLMDTRETGIVSGLCDEGGVQHLATIYIEGGEGNIQFGETQISSGTTMLIPSNGTFTLTAPAGYSIMTATVNGEAFSEVENGQSVVVSNITGDIDLYVTLESLHYRMSVYYEGSNVYTWYRVGYMMDFTCNIVAMEGYQLQSVTLNGEDVTSLLDSEGRLDITNITEDKTLIISSSQNGGTTNYVSSDVNRLRAWQAGENIFVEVDETVQSVMLYDVTGRLMQEYQHMGGYQVITMPVKNLVNLLKVVGKDGSVVSHKLML